MRKQYNISMKLVYESNVVVEANSPEEALDNAKSLEGIVQPLIDAGSELVDWEVLSDSAEEAGGE